MKPSDPRTQRVHSLEYVRRFIARQERDRYWIGRCLFLRRKILGLCEQDGNICKKSVVRIIDQCLPESIVKAEKTRPTKDKRRKK